MIVLRSADTGPRVLHVVLSLDCGGLERIVTDLVRSGAEAGERSEILCLERPGHLAADLEALGLTVHSLGKGAGLAPGLIRKIGRILSHRRPDVVHTHQIGALFYAGAAARLSGFGVVVHTEHGNHLARGSGLWGSLRARLLYSIAGRFADRFLCVSNEIADSLTTLRGFPCSKISAVVNGIDVDRFANPGARARIRDQLGIPADSMVIGTVGRLTEVKRQDRLIRAFSQVVRKHGHARLMLVGSGPMREELQRLAENLGLDDRVHFVGYQPHPEHYLAAMDLFALTSRSEGTPLAILEAWAAGLPVVASAVGGVPGLVEQGRTGLLFDDGDEAKLTSNLQALLLDRALARSISAAGRREVASRYSLEAMKQQYAVIYREIGSRRDAGGSH